MHTRQYLLERNSLYCWLKDDEHQMLSWFELKCSENSEKKKKKHIRKYSDKVNMKYVK